MKQPQNVEMTIMTVQAEVQKLAIQRGLAAELEEVSRGSEQDIDDTSVWRITRAVEAKNTTLAPASEDKAAYDMADNGARINRSEKDGWEKLLSEISFSKEKK
jgi:DNA primase